MERSHRRGKVMDEENKSIFGVAYLYIIISAILSLISVLIETIVSGNQLAEFFSAESLWLVIVAVTIFALYRLNKMQNQSFISLFQDNTVRKSTGVLILISGLMSLSVYIYALVNAVSLIWEGKPDSSVILNISGFIFIVLTILMGTYLLKYKGKTGEGYSAKIVFGIAYLYTIVATAFSLVTKLSRNIGSGVMLNTYYYLWLVFAAAILFVLYRLNKKQNQGFASAFQDDTVRKSTGVLILISGLISLSELLNAVKNIVLLINSNYVTNDYIHLSIIRNSILFVIVVCQILYGIYLLRKSKPGGEHTSKIVLGSVYLLALIAVAFTLVTKLLGNYISGDILTAYYSLWVVLTAAISFVFYRFIKK